MEFLKRESCDGPFGAERAEDLHGKHQILQNGDPQITYRRFHIGNLARHTKKRGIHELENLCRNGHVLLDNPHHLVYGAFGIRKKAAEHDICARKGWQFPQRAHETRQHFAVQHFDQACGALNRRPQRVGLARLQQELMRHRTAR